MYTLLQAITATGTSKQTILKAIQSGTLSASKDSYGTWILDPAEVHRVYPMVFETSKRERLVQEKRQHTRYACAVHIITDDEVKGVSVDLSKGGMRVLSDYLFHVGQQVTLRFKLPLMTSEIKAKAIVRWAKTHFYGFDFVGVSSEGTIMLIDLLDEQHLVALK